MAECRCKACRWPSDDDKEGIALVGIADIKRC